MPEATHKAERYQNISFRNSQRHVIDGSLYVRPIIELHEDSLSNIPAPRPVGPHGKWRI